MELGLMDSPPTGQFVSQVFDLVHLSQSTMDGAPSSKATLHEPILALCVSHFWPYAILYLARRVPTSIVGRFPVVCYSAVGITSQAFCIDETLGQPQV